MLITISINTPDGEREPDIITLEIPDDFTVGQTKDFIKSETKFDNHSPHFYFNGMPLAGDERTLEAAGIKNGEMLAMMIPRERAAPPAAAAAAQDSSQRQRQRTEDPENIETIRQRLLSNRQQLERIRSEQPALAAAVHDRDQFREAWQGALAEEREREREHQRQIALLNEDSMNIEAQRKIEEMIRRERVTENLQDALVNNPEMFGSVTMLYIAVEVNGHPVKAFVDSGAQATIMSPSCAEACGIMRLIDTQFQGIARGVGTAKILGRVHKAEIKIGDAYLPCGFTVMEGKDVDLLFGLDMLRRYRACIDLRRNLLVLEGTEVPFLPESEIPKMYEQAQLDEPAVPGPNGTEIGTISGAIRPAGTSEAAQGSSSRGAINHAMPSRSQPQSQSKAGSSQAPTSGVSQEAVAQLQSIGFSREQAVEALRATDGNVEQAASLLFPP